MIESKKLLNLKKLDKVVENIISLEDIVDNCLIEPYNTTIDNILKFYEGRKELVYDNTDENGVVTKYYLEFSKVHLDVPVAQYSNGQSIKVTPQLAIIKQISYTSNIVSDLKLVCETDGISKVKHNAKAKIIGAIPVMIGSKLDPIGTNEICQKGQYILKGVEKLIITIEEIQDNILIPVVSENGAEVYVYSSVNGYRYVNRLIKNQKKNVEFKFQPLNITVCPFVLLKVLGYTDKDIVDALLPNPENHERMLIILCWLDSSSVDRSEQAAKEMLTKAFLFTDLDNIKDKATHILQNYVLMHLGTSPECIDIKVKYILDMLKILIDIFEGVQKPINIDRLEYKKFKTGGVLLYELFQYCFNKQIEKFKASIVKHIKNRSINLLNLLRSELLTNSLIGPIISGVWLGNRQDVSTTIDRTNPYTYLSTIRKITSPLQKNQLHQSARSISYGFRGRICPLDSGHGSIIGLVKTLALGSLITPNCQKPSFKKFKTGNYTLIVDEIFEKFVDKTEFIKEFKKLRANNTISRFINFSIVNNIIKIRTTSSRIVRYLYTRLARDIDPDVLITLNKEELFSKGYIELLDPLEEQMYSVAPDLEQITDKDEYAEISSLLLFSITAAAIPFLNNAGCARMSYGQKLFKQAIVSDVKKDNLRSNHKKLSVHYTEKPLVATSIQKIIDKHFDVQTGVNLVVAILPYEGYNIEDATIMNKNAIERNLFKTYLYDYKTVESNEINLGNALNGFLHPENIKKNRPLENYETLDIDGIVQPNTSVMPGHAIISNYSLPKYSKNVDIVNLKEPEYIDDTVFNNKEQTVDIVDVTITKNLDLASVACIKEMRSRPTVVGDKFSSRYAQKGVIGNLIPCWASIYEKNSGITPDIILASSAYPTRYLVGHLYEILVGRACAQYGLTADAFFSDSIDTYEDLFKFLESKGLGHLTDTEFIDAKTGLTIKSKVFTGVSYFLKLQHLAEEKLHMRATGPVQLLTRQATEGRSKAGGLRIGEMQRDCIIAYGAADLILERLSIDLYEFLLCGQCGELLDLYVKETISCKICNTPLFIHKIKIPYAFKLLIDELNALHIKVQMLLDKYETYNNRI